MVVVGLVVAPVGLVLAPVVLVVAPVVLVLAPLVLVVGRPWVQEARTGDPIYRWSSNGGDWSEC